MVTVTATATVVIWDDDDYDDDDYVHAKRDQSMILKCFNMFLIISTAIGSSRDSGIRDMNDDVVMMGILLSVWGYGTFNVIRISVPTTGSLKTNRRI